jgi:hypothetical protein
MMSLLVRKIDKGKWLQTNISGGEDVSADAVTNCLRTKGNALSVWGVETEAEIDEAVLAIVTGHQHLETIDVVSLSPEHLAVNGIDYQQTQGLHHRIPHSRTVCRGESSSIHQRSSESPVERGSCDWQVKTRRSKRIGEKTALGWAFSGNHEELPLPVSST